MYAHVEVPAGTATELRQALAAQTQDRIGLRTRIDLGQNSTLKCGKFNIRPEHGIDHVDCFDPIEVTSMTLETRIVGGANGDKKIAGRKS